MLSKFKYTYGDFTTDFVTSVYSKPANVHQNIMLNSATPQSSLQALSKGVATRLRQICSKETDFKML